MACSTLLGSVVAFVALFGVAAASYPGGSWLEPDSVGYRFWENFFCDALHATALNGAPNRVGAATMTAAMLCLTAGLLPMWWLLPQLFADCRRLGRAVRWLGPASVLLTAAVPFVPSDRFPSLHGIATVSASALSLLTLSLALWGLARTARRRPRLLALGGIMALSVALSALLYVRNQYFGAPLTVLLPASQKVAAMLLIGWMLGIAHGACRHTHA